MNWLRPLTPVANGKIRREAEVYTYDIVMIQSWRLCIFRDNIHNSNEQQNPFDGYSNADLDVVLVHTVSFTKIKYRAHQKC